MYTVLFKIITLMLWLAHYIKFCFRALEYTALYMMSSIQS